MQSCADKSVIYDSVGCVFGKAHTLLDSIVDIRGAPVSADLHLPEQAPARGCVPKGVITGV